MAPVVDHRDTFAVGSERDLPTKLCGRCGGIYGGYTYLVKDDFCAITLNVSIEHVYSQVCPDCRVEIARVGSARQDRHMVEGNW